MPGTKLLILIFINVTDTELVVEAMTENDSFNELDLLRQDLMLTDEGSSSDVYEPSDEDKLSSTDSQEEMPKRKKKKLARWSTSEPGKWKKNVEKLKKKSGEPYVTKKGFVRSKVPKPISCATCRWQCSSKFDEDLRKKICSEFWKLDYCRQKEFIIKYVVNEPTKTRRIRSGSGTKKNYSRVYFFQKEDEKVRVCKSFFLMTLAISHGPVEKALAGVNDVGIFTQIDQRGKKEPSNKTSPDVLQNIKAHIESFPSVESHYCRKTTKRQYLDPRLSIRKMYALYLEDAKEREKATGVKVPVVEEITYRRYFCKNYNLSFFNPKKDQCVICKNYDNTENQDQNMVEEYAAHIERKKQAYRAKEADKLRAGKDKSFLSATFDLQSVLQVPSSDVSPMYYSRKLSVYNLCIYEVAEPNKAFCFLWSELNGKKGSCEIGTALFQWISQIPSHIKEISLYSDTCGGQNRNQYIAALFMYVVQNTHLESIEHKFMESGHSYLEADSMHSAIEVAKENVSVYSVNDWVNIMIMARSNRGKHKKRHAGPYTVKELNFSDILDLKMLGEKIMHNRTLDDNKRQVQWLKIKVLRFEKKNPGVISFKYNIEDEEFQLLRTYKIGRPPNMPIELNKLYSRKLPISAAKKKDLVKLCTKKVIPQEYHPWYKSLPVEKINTTDKTLNQSDDNADSSE